MNALWKIILLPVMIWLAVGCNRSYNLFNGTYRYEPYSGVIEQLIAEPVGIDVLGFKVLWIEDSLLFVSTPQGPGKLVSVHSLNDYRPIYEGLLLRGNGPNEYFNMEFISSYTDSLGIKMWFSVDYLRKLLCVDITRSIADKKLTIIKEVDLSQLEDSFALHYVFMQSDSSFVLMRGFTNYQISVYNSVSQKERFIGWLYAQNVENQNITDLSAGSIYDPDKSVLVSGMSFFNQINFYYLEHPEHSFSISSAKKATHYNLVRQIGEMAERPWYYGSRCRADDMIVFTYLGGKKGYEMDSLDDNYLHIVDRNGKFQRMIQIDRPFAGEAFDKRTGYLYGVDAETWDIIKYKIR